MTQTWSAKSSAREGVLLDQKDGDAVLAQGGQRVEATDRPSSASGRARVRRWGSGWRSASRSSPNMAARSPRVESPRWRRRVPFRHSRRRRLTDCGRRSIPASRILFIRQLQRPSADKRPPAPPRRAPRGFADRVQHHEIVDRAIIAYGGHGHARRREITGIGFALVAQHVILVDDHQRGRQAAQAARPTR